MKSSNFNSLNLGIWQPDPSMIEIVNSRFLQRSQKRSHGNQLIHRSLTKKSIGRPQRGQDPESKAGKQSDCYIWRMVFGVETGRELWGRARHILSRIYNCTIFSYLISLTLLVNLSCVCVRRDIFCNKRILDWLMTKLGYWSTDNAITAHFTLHISILQLHKLWSTAH